MQDGLTCVDCGRDAYPEVFGAAIMVLSWPEGMIDRSPEGRERAWAKASQRRHDEKIALYAIRYAASPESVERWLAQNPPRTRWQRFVLWWKGLFK